MKEEMIQKFEAEQQESTREKTADEKTIHSLRDTVNKLQKEIKVVNEKV